MKTILCCVSCLALILVPVHCGDVNRLVRTLHALTRALHYFQKRVQEINLDAVYCIRQVQEQLQEFLTHDELEFRTFRHWIEVLRDKAKSIADQGRIQVAKTEPSYFDTMGYSTDVSPRNVWYATRNTSEQFLETRVQCRSSQDNFNEEQSDLCFHELSLYDEERCPMTPQCIEMNTKRYQRDFVITHQMLFWRHAELQGCIEKVPEELQQRLCANVMRDAKVIASADYPESHQDLFMESIGLCGFWGYGDFNKPEWAEKVLEWQYKSGCYSMTGTNSYYCTDDLQPDPPSRVKRNEVILSDNCFAHKTAVAVLAITSIIRFEAENVFQTMDPSRNTLNKLLV